MKVYSIDGITPVIDPTAFVHPSAVLIGDVIIGPRCYVGPAACLRGDFGRLVLKEGANIQDTCVMHGFPGTDTVVEEDGHIGHGAVLHGCVVKRNALVGMNAVIMDGAVVGESSIVAAMAFVKAKFEVPDRTLVAGSPARIVRELGEKEIAWKTAGTRQYQDLAVRSLNTMQAVEPLTEVEADRKRLSFEEDVVPLYQVKQTAE
ncbi:MAG: phenylacetic acid degradation protein PaaY [Oceanospirillales bacterium]|uniref:Phenylacetic acid degradation protein n=1 Tax=Marinobacterium halophilum TaxID=267374 RepID=A0A2P8F073_9GAMM|nr:phenylacetic acid degradation protein PaaY [Marinobacterium halophilum]MBR9829589.1 phenylacetic acid degradation protein PaaY [Oceanospirillales bacterium]PSL15120.1 phenylacetic acid degradation protein [Marinobacterium halophilum]